MGTNEKALYFCNAHPNLFLQKDCIHCNRGLCHTCIASYGVICPACSKNAHTNSSTYAYKRQLFWMLGSGMLTLAFFLFFFYYQTEVITITDSFYVEVILAFLFGANFTAANYFLETNSIIEKMKKIPILGFKLSVVALIFIFITGIPVLYFLYKLIKSNINHQ